jgi:hypothetical protein
LTDHHRFQWWAARGAVLSRRGEYDAAQQKSLTSDLIQVTSSAGEPFVKLEVLLQPDDLCAMVFEK